MPLRFIVQLDMEKLRERLAGSPPVSAEEVAAWLRATGFVATEDPAIWVGEEGAVDELLPNEVVDARMIP